MMAGPVGNGNTARKATSSKTKHNDYALQGNRQLRKKQRRARFNNVVTVSEIPSHRVFTFDERFAVWYSRSEYRCFSLQESIRKLKADKTSIITELSDRLRCHGYPLLPKSLHAKSHKRKFRGENIVANNQKPAKMSKELHEAVSLVVEARNITNRRLAQIQWRMQQEKQQLLDPLWSFQPLIPNLAASISTMQTKQGILLPHIPFDFSGNKVPFQGSGTPMTDPKSPVARGA